VRVILFCHSLVSDWNHGNAHFLRGVCGELLARGHDVRVYESEDAWSVANLVAEHGEQPLRDFARAYPALRSTRYRMDALDLDTLLDGADLVLVHEWNDPALVKLVGLHRKAGGGYRLLFHDTHHRSVTEPESMASNDLRHYDGVLAFGSVIRDRYLEMGWSARAWTWHEAADVRVFQPLPRTAKVGDLVWIGNWGDGERTAELQEYLVEPVRALQLRAKVYGVRYAEDAQRSLAHAGIDYAGWLPNYQVPAVFARYAVTLHVPRRPYVQALPGIPTIRVFEALACGIPLVCAPWDDCEGLFEPGADYLTATSGRQMREQLRAVLHEPGLAQSLAEHGRRTILTRHTCAHRVDELLAIYANLLSPRQQTTEAKA
jgi:spore maturation protein CgeB